MARSQQTFSKIEKEKKKIKKREDKQKKKVERRANSKKGSGFDNMIAYVDEYGQLSDTPPDPTKKKKVKASSIEIAIPKREHIEIDPIRKGKVAFFNDSKGYGFITEDETQEKYFVHINGLIDDVIEGNKVVFELEKGLKGLNAVRVKKV